MIVFKRSKNLLRVFKKYLARLNGKSMPCSSTKPSLCCAQILTTQTFMSKETKRTFNIFHKLTWKSRYVTYLMECILCKIQRPPLIYN